MKRLLSTFIIFTFIFITGMPLKGFAAVKPKIELKQAIEIAKNALKLETKGYDFSYNYYENEKKTWMLQWNQKGGVSGSIYVFIDAENGDILSMNIWSSSDQPTSKIPKYTKDQGLKKAEDFIKKLQPLNYKYVKFDNSFDYYYPYDNIYSNTYNFRFIRYINNIPFPDNGMYVSINKNTLKVVGYSYQWDEKELPSSQKAIKIEDGKKIFEDKLGLELSYQAIYDYQKNKIKPILVYSLKKGNYPIDALTGELLYNYGPYFGSPLEKNQSMDKPAGSNLTPEEQISVDTSSKYISSNEAAEVVKKYFTISDKYKLESSSLFINKLENSASWYLQWNYRDEKNNEYGNISARVNAENSNLMSFYINSSDYAHKSDEKPALSKDQARKIAEDFLKNIEPAKYPLTELREYNRVYPVYENETGYYFTFIRKHNNIPCPFNNFTVYVDAYSGKILSYNMSWFEIDLPSSENVIDLNDAYLTLYKKCDFSLKYIKMYSPVENNYSNIKLVYSLNKFNGYIDAKSKELLDYSGNPVKEITPVAYKDIKNTPYEKDIKLLVEFGIIDFPGEKYLPNNKIQQKDFIKMLVKILNPYYEVNSEKDNYDAYYKIAVERKILTEKEINPNLTVTRQSAAKYLINSLNLGYIAKLNGIYSSIFKDFKNISNEYKGYAVLSSGLKIILPEKGCFNPKKEITRGEAANILVNYLKVNN
ncbi:propeptide PepSY amd peptidase M4 [Fervidicella metallireducens AeB]|uniref:Propeptide PepSY amd peptidase M4 n=1 Tax=Fervidicella metallireducens AeB TaxID=1403537 RepID=A0A017RY32_9CLOT|nr:YcdB/YcdC domain-containing protein [Fervidicella metallireducens]EYE89547.1 propeptide PepSY amd peptidase M4 [Fervidicella metallireducens AeB]